ncbi:hypothetical protein GF356_06195 [candidate division GN15 bacterium]|nr:hypothetical protein [candidate division GN15 bacterium]
MRVRSYLVIALISLTLIPLELSWTRIFSAEFFYTFAFLVLSLAVLGLGLGALSLRLFRSIDRPGMLGASLTLAGICALVGPILVFALSPDFSTVFSDLMTTVKIMLVVLILMSTYVFAGIGLAMLFKHNHDDMPRLYMADLLGAGVGVVAAIWAMNLFGTPAAAFLIAVPVLIAASIVTQRWVKIIPVLVALTAIALSPAADGLLELERDERAPVIYKHWDAMSKVKVYDYGGRYRGLNIDNVANSPVYPFDGDFSAIDPDSVQWGIDASYLIDQFDSCIFLSLGAGGGTDVFQALVEGATEVHAVEINQHINKMMLKGDPGGYLVVPEPDSSALDSVATDTTVGTVAEVPVDSADTAVLVDPPGPVTLAEFSGHIYSDPRVKVVTEDARAYVRRFENKFDLIYSLSSNSWAALASGAFALAENYLFTTEAFVDYWHALSDSGFMMMEHQVYVPRLTSEVMLALDRAGVDDPTQHFAVYDLPQMRRKMILLSKRPLTDSIRYYAFGPLTEERFGQIHLLYPPASDSLADNLINQIVTQGWRSVADSARIDISPVSDDRPFVAQLGLWRNLTGESMEKVIPYAEFYGFPLSRLVMLIILAVVLLIIIPANLLPYVRTGPKLKAAPWLYFFAIGVAFMAVEVILIQKYGLLIGSSLYSIATVLLTLLVASGIGSRFSNGVPDSVAFGAIVGWLLLDAFVFSELIYAVDGFTLTWRILFTGMLIFPLGFFMGMPFPKGTRRVGELIDWGFAVNGAASVLGSIVVLFIAFAWGFTVALAFGALIYAVAWLLISRRGNWQTRPPQVAEPTTTSAGESTTVSHRQWQ